MKNIQNLTDDTCFYIQFPDCSGYVTKQSRGKKSDNLPQIMEDDNNDYILVIMLPTKHEYDNYARSVMDADLIMRAKLADVPNEEKWRFQKIYAYIMNDDNNTVKCAVPCFIVNNKQTTSNFVYMNNIYDLHLDKDEGNYLELRDLKNVLFKRETSTSPLFNDKRTRPVFHSLEDCMTVMDNVKDMHPAISELYEMLKIDVSSVEEEKKEVSPQPLVKKPTLASNLADDKLLQRVKPPPLVVLEGLDGAGKTTLAKKLAETHGGTYLYGLIDDMVKIRYAFDSFPELIRRCYYSINNFRMSKRLLETRDKPIFMDRFFNSTMAYAIASTTTQVGEIPPEGSDIFDWPEDLILPFAVIYLKISFEEQQARLKTKKLMTEEEQEILDKKKGLRERLNECYDRTMKANEKDFRIIHLSEHQNKLGDISNVDFLLLQDYVGDDDIKSLF